MRDTAICEALREAGLWPETSGESTDLTVGKADEDLLPAICQAWESCRGRADGRADRAAAGRGDWFRQAREAGARLTWSFPGLDQTRTVRWLGARLAWWPDGIPHRRRVGLVSSRLGQQLDQHKSWFAALRTACMRLNPQHDILVTAGQTATQRFVQRCGRLFGLTLLDIQAAGSEATAWRRWGRQVVASVPPPPHAPARVLLSPPLAAGSGAECLEELAGLPLSDRVILALCDQILALHIRPEGNVQRLLRARLQRDGFPAASVFLALAPELVGREQAAELLDAGAVGWLLMDPVEPGKNAPPTPWLPVSSAPRRAAPLVPCPPATSWSYLTHCTRRRSGPWPGENEETFLDDLILDRPGADHSALAALWRIVRSGRLMASSELVRGSTPVISLTEVPLSELGRLRAYRSHLGRWDFEPYGICIRRDWLERRGTRPVCYGDEALWESLPPAERPYFQKRQSRTPGGKQIDWTVEQEWRHVGDLRLDGIPADAALLFVASETEARQLAPASPWPIVVLSADEPGGSTG